MSEKDDGKVRDDRLEGRYSNFFKVGYNAYEIVIDFGQCYDGEAEGFHTRIVTSPQYARKLLEILSDSIARCELTYGPIRDDH